MKIGKTEFLTQAPDALILAFEIGTNARPGAYVQPITKWTEFKLVLKQLEKDEIKQKFSTIGIDTVAIAYDACEQFICAQNGVTKIGDIPYGGGYAQLSKEFESSLRKITMMGYGLAMTTHLKEISDESGKILGYKPDLNNRCLKIVNGLVDVIGVITQTWNEKGESERWIQTRATPTITAGSRFKYLDPIIPFGYNEFVKALGKAIDMEAAAGATVVDNAPIVAEEKLDFNALLNEAKTIWNEMIQKYDGDEEKQIQVAQTMAKKVENIFNKKIKLSEVIEDQVDLLNLAVMDLREYYNNNK